MTLPLAFGGCGSGKQAPGIESRQNAQAFTLSVNEASLFDEASADSFDLEVIQRDGGADAVVRVSGAAGLKALYLDLEFDPELYAPAGVEPGALLGDPAELLTLELLTDRGCVHFGQVLIHPQERAGFSGDGVLATIRFSSGPQAGERVVSVPPTLPASQTMLTKQGSLLEWYYYNLGDYNQDGLVTINDLTPLGVHYQVQSPGFPAPFPIDSVQSVVDGNGDGMITINDITPIGANYQCSVLGGYNAYESLDVADYPADPADFGEPPTIPELINVPFNTALGATNADRLRFQTYISTTLVNAYYWVRPTDGTDDGTPSNLTGGDSTTAVQFSVASTPATGSGTQSDPYAISGGGAIDFVLFDPVSSSTIPPTDPAAVLVLDNPAAGQLAGFQLTVDASYAGQFAVFALYEDRPTNPQKICFYVTQAAGANNPPVALAHAAPTAGAAPLYVVFYGGSSYDLDAGDAIASHEWDFGEGAGYQALWDTEIHQYAAAGTYDAALRVTDTNGASDTTALRITVSQPNPNGPTAKLTVNPNSGDMPLAVMFDASLSTAGANPIASYEYDLLGNGAFVVGGPTNAYTYNQAGIYRVTMKVTDSAGLTDADWVDVIVTDPGGAPAPPQAVLAAAPDRGMAPLGVVFDLTGSTTGAGIEYELDPNDGSPAYDPAAYPTQAHTYSADGTYIAMLVTTDTGSGTRSLPAFRDIIVVTPAGSLTAVLNATPPGGPAPLHVTLDATGTSGGTGPYTYDFDFTSDGSWDVTGDTTGTAGHTYSTNGVYTARVRVTDSASATDEDTVQITVATSGGNLVASLTANPAAGGAPLAVTLDATGSFGGTPPYTFEFDYTDDGTYDVTGNTTGSAPNTYSTAADYTARVRVTDSSTPAPQVAMDTALIEVTVPLAPQLTANPPCGLNPLTTTLDATGTTGGKAPLSYDFDFEDDGSWDVSGDTTGSVSGVVYSSVGPYTARVRVTDSCTTPQTAETTTSVFSAAILTPNLTATSATWLAPPAGQVTLDASATTGGTPPLEYRFDYDGDGTWDTAWGSSASAVPPAPYYAPGYHVAAVGVRDGCTAAQQTGQTSTMFTISRNPSPPPPSGWHVQTVATGITGHAMSYTGLTLVQGIPMISFYDDTPIPGQQGLYCVEANDPQGNSWKPPIMAQPGMLGIHSSIKEVVGEPAIAYFNHGLWCLEYIRRLPGSLWPVAGNVLDAVNCGSWCSMDFIYDDTPAVQQWLPAVSYIGDIGALEFEWWWHGAQVRYVASTSPPDNLGTTWLAPQVVDSSIPLGYPQFACTSLEYIDYTNNYPLLPPPYTWSPAVSYIALDWDPSPNGLKYSLAADRLGANWARPGYPMWVMQTPQASVGTMTSLEKFPGMPWDPYLPGAPPTTPGLGWMPWISWDTNVLPAALALEESTTAQGGPWVVPQHQPDPSPPAKVGDFSSLEMVGPVLGISHCDYGIGELRYVDMSGTNPLGWNAAEFPDPQAAAGSDWKWGTYLIENQGYPAISYYYSYYQDPIWIYEVRYAVYY